MHLVPPADGYDGQDDELPADRARGLGEMKVAVAPDALEVFSTRRESSRL